MKSKIDDPNAKNDENAVPPNTLAWAARTLDKAQIEEKSLWQIVPDVLIKQPKSSDGHEDLKPKRGPVEIAEVKNNTRTGK